MFGVDKCTHAALFLGLGNDMQSQGRLARGFGAIDLDDPAAREAANPERNIKAERACRYSFDLNGLLIFAKAHDRAFAKSPFDLRQSGVERLGFVHGRPFHETEVCEGHGDLSFWHEQRGGATSWT